MSCKESAWRETRQEESDSSLMRVLNIKRKTTEKSHFVFLQQSIESTIELLSKSHEENRQIKPFGNCL